MGTYDDNVRAFNAMLQKLYRIESESENHTPEDDAGSIRRCTTKNMEGDSNDDLQPLKASIEKWASIVLWFMSSAIFSTYLNTKFLLVFNGDAFALTLFRFLGSALIGHFINLLTILNGHSFNLTGFFKTLRAFVIPALSLLVANLFNSFSLERGGITLTYVVKAGIPLVTVLICILNGQSVSAKTVAAMIPIVVGVGLSAYADTQFSWDGFFAAWISTIAQSLLNVTSKTGISITGLSPQQSQLVLVSIASFFLLVINAFTQTMIWERFFTLCYGDSNVFLVMILTVIAYHVEYVLNFIVTKYVSEVLFSVLDVMRRLSIIIVGAMIFGNSLSYLNIFGVILALTGVMLFSQLKFYENIEQSEEKYPRSKLKGG